MTYKMFVDENTLDDLAKEQFYNCIEHPAFRKAALMPDAHGGYDAPIGAVIALKDWVVPSWVGYDIGCGMCAVKLSIKRNEIDEVFRKELPVLKDLHTNIHRSIPCGEYFHKDPVEEVGLDRSSAAIRQALETRKVRRQLGTLGGGNHFLELATDEDNNVWIVIHSGSRGLGHEVAGHWMKRQKQETNGLGWYSKSKDGLRYIKDMDQCLRYALINRRVMIDRTIKAICSTYKIEVKADWDTFINRNHNHMDQAYGYCIHRKGATHSEKDMMGVIPGNMRDGSYIVKGLGNSDALWSSSHGAGRKFSRTQAKKSISLEKFKADMIGITGDVKMATLDEAPDAYKNIADVIQIQVENEVLEVVHKLKTFLNVKG